MLKLSTDKTNYLEKEIQRLVFEASNEEPDSERYRVLTENIERLQKAKSYDKSSTVSPDVKATIICNLAIALLVLGYEKAGTITSKAWGLISKGRV